MSTPAGGSSLDNANVAAAKAAVDQYTKGPSPFPVDQPLPKPLPAGTRFSYLQTSPPLAAQLGALLSQGSQLIGAKFDVVNGGSSTEQAQSGFSTILERKPTAILLPSIEPDQINQQLRQADSDKIPVVATGIMNTAKYGIDAGVLGDGLARLAGKLLADWVAVHEGQSADAALFVTPELSFSAFVQQAYTDEIAKVCPGCQTHVVKVPLASFANSAPSLETSDLQSHPKAKVAVFAANEAATGLPVALKTAGVNVDVVGFGPSPANLQDIEAGRQTAALGLDFPCLAWGMIDEAARLVEGAPLTEQEKLQAPPIQFLDRNNLKGDVSKGWSGYPDYAKRFAGFWQANK